MKKVVVFGATGSLGAHISIFLKERGYRVYAVGRRKNADSFFAKYDIPYISMDISDSNGFKDLPTDIYAILHFAGALPAGMKGYDASLYISSIIQGTLNVLEYARLINVDRIVFPQSLYTYRTEPLANPIGIFFMTNSLYDFLSISSLS